MAIPTLRAKNQVTLPADIVTRAGLHVGVPLKLEVKGKRIVIEAYPTTEEWTTADVLAEIDEAAKGPYKVFSSMDDLERNLDV